MDLTVEALVERVKSSDDIIPVIQEAMQREGFARKTLQFKQLKKGEPNQIALRKKDISFSGNASQVRQTYNYPPEFNIIGAVELNHADEAQDPEIVIETIFKILEATLVKEDRIWKQQADKLAITIPGRGIGVLTAVAAALRSRNVKPGMWLWGSNVWKHVASNLDLDPVSKRQLNQTGRIPALYGMPIHTDAFRDSTLAVLGPNEVYALPEPLYLGVLSERMPLTITATSGGALGRPVDILTYEMLESIMMIGNIVRAEI